ncbi:MAG: hypothetical protein ACE5NC_09660 [Anaerolineae bacterium]
MIQFWAFPSPTLRQYAWLAMVTGHHTTYLHWQSEELEIRYYLLGN